MLFNSYVFIFAFMPIVLLGWWFVLRTPKQRTAFLALSSFSFYAYHDFPMGAKLLPLMCFVIALGYYTGKRMHASENRRERKFLLIMTLAANIGMLCFFKYLGFFAETINFFIGEIGRGEQVPVVNVLFPIGISFYTFTSMSYTIDVYRRNVPPARSLLEFATFMTFFPHLVMGPVVRFSEMGPQLRMLPKKLTPDMLATGAFFFVCGLFKKLVLADAVAPTVDRLFAVPEELTVVTGWVAALGYTLQLYFDFSGYSDMAVGLALLLGFHFPQNFNSPYKATSMSQFWSRWHMTLSRWLRDYLYFPLGGSRKGHVKTLRNVVIVMFIGGMWHGGNWTFIVWGLAHGVLLVVENVAAKRGFTPPSEWMKRALTFFWVVYLRVIFRASTLVGGLVIMGAMVGTNGLGLDSLTLSSSAGTDVPLHHVGLLAALTWFVNVAPNTWEIEFKLNRRWAFALGGGLATSVLLLASPSPFIYIQF